MKKSWFRIKRQYLSYSRSDRNAVIILSGLILLVIIANRLLVYLPDDEPEDFTEIKRLIASWENEKTAAAERFHGSLFVFDPNTVSVEKLDTLALPYFVRQNIISYRKAGGSFNSPEDFRKIYGMNDSLFARVEKYIQIAAPEVKAKVVPPEKKIVEMYAFDPNQASADELRDLGFSEYQASNLVSYRNNGGRLFRKEDLLKIYGIDTAFYERVKDFLSINVEKEISEVPRAPLADSLDLNTADTTTLMTLPGIGSAYARRIIRYRELLGGFYSKEQVQEIYNFPEETYAAISGYLYADSVLIAKLRINFLEYPELIRHPYLNKEQVKQLLDRRQKKGSFKNISELASIQAFDNETLRKIAPYISCQ